MRIAVLIVVLVVVLGLAGGVVYAGLFPPRPHVHSVDRTVPNDQFQTH